MKYTLDQVKLIKADFKKEYHALTPDSPINYVGCPSIGSAELMIKRKIDLKQGESLDDLCLLVGFETAEGLDEWTYPYEYKGVRVLYMGVIGKNIPADK